jgi:hypothetical protein
MKNLAILFALGLILLTGCTKDESYQPIEEQTIDSVYVLNQSEGGNSWEAMPTQELIRDSARPNNLTVDAASAHTNGYYESSNSIDTTIISWSGSQSNGLTRGSAEIKMTGPDYSFQFVMETECVTLKGNEAVYGGTITEIGAISGKPPYFDLGWRFYFKVVDYQRGAHQFDKISNMMIFASPMSQSMCGTTGPENHIWSSLGYTEVQRPGFVVVSY